MFIKTQELLPLDIRCDGIIEVPPWAFTPDAWSFAFLRGLQAIACTLTELRVWEVGVGTGLNQLLLAKWSKASKLYFSDYGHRCTTLAARNLEQTADERFTPLFGQWDLVNRIDQVEEPPLVDVIVACIPQVPTTNLLDLDVGDNLAHYYDASRYEASLHTLGLGLNEALLHRAHGTLTHGGRVVLNLGGRPGLPRLEKMFYDCGYVPRVVHAEMIAQCPSTSLASLAAMEEHEQEFEFFADAAGHERINAQLAEKRRLEKLGLYHKIYIIEGRSKV